MLNGYRLPFGGHEDVLELEAVAVRVLNAAELVV